MGAAARAEAADAAAVATPASAFFASRFLVRLAAFMSILARAAIAEQAPSVPINDFRSRFIFRPLARFACSVRFLSTVPLKILDKSRGDSHEIFKEIPFEF